MSMTRTKPRSKKHERFQLHFDADVLPSKTKQNHKDECDINAIMRKYQKTGAIEHTNKYAPTYGDAYAFDLQTALNMQIQAQEMFDALPANVKKHCEQDPAKFLEMVRDPDQEEKMREFGLLPKKAAPDSLEEPRKTDTDTTVSKDSEPEPDPEPKKE